MLCVYFFCSSRAEIVWFELHTSVSPAYCSIWLLAMNGRYHVYPRSGCGISMQLIPHLVGQLLLLFAQDWKSS